MQRTNKLDSRRVAVNVDHDPEGGAGVDAGEENALVVPVHVEDHVAAGREMEGEEDAHVNVSLGKSLAPKSRATSQIYREKGTTKELHQKVP